MHIGRTRCGPPNEVVQRGRVPQKATRFPWHDGRAHWTHSARFHLKALIRPVSQLRDACVGANVHGRMRTLRCRCFHAIGKTEPPHAKRGSPTQRQACGAEDVQITSDFGTFPT
jgi:hypothetical protein